MIQLDKAVYKLYNIDINLSLLYQNACLSVKKRNFVVQTKIRINI